jgi:hypothetical protein
MLLADLFDFGRQIFFSTPPVPLGLSVYVLVGELKRESPFA